MCAPPCFSASLLLCFSASLLFCFAAPLPTHLYPSVRVPRRYSNECSSISEARKICEANPDATGFAHKPDDNWFFFKTGFSEAGAEWATTDEGADEGNWEFHFIRERA